MRASVILTMALMACGGGSSHPDGATHTDGATSSNDGGADLSAMLPVKVCTTKACAESPCTAGCKFESPNSATSCDAQVATATVQACTSFCGFAENTTGCYSHTQSAYCESCGPYKDQCYPQDYTDVDYTEGGAICQSGSVCFYGSGEDIGYFPVCDMSEPTDGGDAGSQR